MPSIHPMWRSTRAELYTLPSAANPIPPLKFLRIPHVGAT